MSEPPHATNGSPQAQAGPLEPDWIRELSLNCRQYVWSKLRIELDGTPETLPILDHYVALVRSDAEAAPHAHALVTQAMAAYFGTVVALAIDGFWRVPSHDESRWLVCARQVYLALNPVAVAHDVLHASTEHDGPSSQLHLDPLEREVIEQRLARLPALSEDEYFTFAARFEALDIAVAALREQHHERGALPVVFSPADYSTL